MVTWIYIKYTKLMDYFELLMVHQVFYILSFVVNCINCIALLVVNKMTKNNYFEIFPQYMREDKREEKFKLKHN